MGWGISVTAHDDAQIGRTYAVTVSDGHDTVELSALLPDEIEQLADEMLAKLATAIKQPKTGGK